VRSRQRAQSILDDGGQFLSTAGLARAHAHQAGGQRKQVPDAMIHLAQQRLLLLLGPFAFRDIPGDRGCADDRAVGVA
jgi:hypothetical protein